MSNFITPVSMQVSQEQYSKDLGPQLFQMGYRVPCGIFKKYLYACDGIVNDLTFKPSNITHIDYYNPKLFLALAGMTDSPMKVGDWVKKNNWNICQIDEVAEDTFRSYRCGDAWVGPFIRKATKEEIIQHFNGGNGLCPPNLDKTIITSNETFKEGDTVYHWNYGEGEIFKAWGVGGGYRVTFRGLSINLPIEELSFTPYNFISGGFSHKRPLPDIKTGTPIFVWNDPKEVMVKKFKEWCHDLTRTQDSNLWKYWSLENPVV